MVGGAMTHPETESTRSLDSIAWEGVQDAVRSFRQALRRGDGRRSRRICPRGTSSVAPCSSS